MSSTESAPLSPPNPRLYYRSANTSAQKRRLCVNHLCLTTANYGQIGAPRDRPPSNRGDHMTTTTNGAPADNEAAARRVVFATDDKAPDLPAEVKRQPRSGECWADFLITIAREIGLIAGDASLDADAKRRYAEEMIALAEQDAIFGGSRSGRAILQADTLWTKRNPELSAELGKLSESARDLAGRAVAGPAKAVALLLETLSEDVTTSLSPDQAELLRSLVPGVVEAIEERDQVIAEQDERVLTAVNAGQIDHPPGQPGVPVVRSETIA